MTSRDIVFDLNLPIASEVAWKLWTDSKLLETWLTTVAEVDATHGGSYELFWDPSNRLENSTLGCKITSFVPGKVLTFEWRGPVPYADLMNVSPFPTWVSINIESVGLAQTIVHFRHSGLGEGEWWDQARQWQTNAWTMAFKEFVELAKADS